MVRKSGISSISRRDFLKLSSTGIAAAALGDLALSAPRRARAQTKAKLRYVWPFAAAPDIQQTLVDQFNAQSSTVEVELQVIPQDSAVPTMTTAFSAGEGPDVVAMSPGWLTQFAAAGWLENLDERMVNTGLIDTLLPVALSQSRMYQDQAYMIGCVVDTYPMYYNKQHFADAGITAPPETTEAFAEVARKLTDARNNRYGYYLLGGSQWTFQQWVLAMLNQGGIGFNNTLYDEDGKSVLRGEEHIAGLRQWVSLYQDDQVSPAASATGTFNDAANAFNAGQVSIVMGFLGYIRNFSNGIGQENFGVAIPPGGPAGQFVHYAANGFAMNSMSADKDAAWDFIAFLMRPEINSALNEAWGALPSVTAALEAEYLENPVFTMPKQMVQMNDSFVHTPRQFPEWGFFFNTTSPEQIQATLLGQQSVEDFASNVSADLEEMYAANQ